MELGARFGLLERLRGYRSPGGLDGTHCPLPTRPSKRVWQTCPIAPAAAVARKTRLCTSSTTVSGFNRFGATWGSGRPASIPNSSCCLTLVTSWTILTLRGEKRVVFLVILVVARMVIWTMRKKGLYDSANFSHRDLVLLFRRQLRVKIRCYRKRLHHITFDKRWVSAVSLAYERGQRWSHPSFLFLCIATMVRVFRDPTPGK